MGRIKDKLLDSEYKDMNLNGNENISEYLLTINASESDGLYHIEYCIMDLRKLESVKITEKINESDLNNLIDPTLWKILYQNEYGLYSKITYKTLCNDVFTDDKYLFQAIALQKRRRDRNSTNQRRIGGNHSPFCFCTHEIQERK